MLIESYHKLLQTHFLLLKTDYLKRINYFWLLFSILIKAHSDDDD